MATMIWAICCQRAIIDRETNGLSLVDHFEGLTLPSLPPKREDGALPLVPLRFSVVSYWMRTDEAVPESWELRVRLLDPQGNSHVEGNSTVNLQTSQTARNIVGFPGFPIAGPGSYTIEIARKVADKWEVEPASPKLRLIVADLSSKQPVTAAAEPAKTAKRKRKK